MPQREIMEAPPVELAPPVAFAKLAALESALERAIRGKAEVLRLSLVCLLSRGHLLIEDVPGVGKTTLAQALARSVDCRFHRLQFTSDMRSEEHTSELQSHSDLVCRLLLEKKKYKTTETL